MTNPNPEQPLVSLVVAVYNVEPYIEFCARALFGQTYQNIEYIFVDDCSPDGSIAILNKVLDEFSPSLRERVKILRHDRNRGVAAARITALDHISGDWVLMHDSDDWLSLDTVERLVEQIADDVDMVTFDYAMGPSPDQMKIYTQHQPPTDGRELIAGILQRWEEVPCWLSNKLVRASLFSEHHIRCTEGLNLGEDMTMTFKLACHTRRIVHVPLPMLHYLRHEGSMCDNYRLRKNEVSFCANFSDAVAYIRRCGLYERFRSDFQTFVFLYKYRLLLRAGMEHADCVRTMLPAPDLSVYMSKGKTGLSFRKRMIVFCAIRGWSRLTTRLISLHSR